MTRHRMLFNASARRPSIAAALLTSTSIGPAAAATFPAELDLRATPPESVRFLEGGVEGAGFGTRVYPLGDIDGDGFDDVVLGEDASPTSGRTWLVFGNDVRGDLTPGSDDNDTNIVAIVDGFAFERAGDWTGDGIDDWLSRSGDARHTLIAGSNVRPSAPIDIDALADEAVAPIVDSSSPAIDYSQRVLPVGDFDGDGREDLIVLRQDPPNVGDTRLLLLPGRSDGLPERLDLATVPPEQQGVVRYVYSENPGGAESFSRYIDIATGGDLNGDGLGDIVLGMNEAYDRAGLVYVLFGNPGGVIPDIGPSIGLGSDALDGSTGFAAVSGEARAAGLRSNVGREVRVLPDADGDGIDELLVSSNTHAYVMHGRGSGWPALLDLDAPGTGAGFRLDGFARELGVAGDLNGDGLGDWWLTAERRVRVVYGSAEREPVDALVATGVDGFTIRQTLRLDRDLTPAERAGDLDGDGVDDLLVSSPYAVGVGEYDRWLLDPSAELDAPRVGWVALLSGRRETGLPASPLLPRALLGPDLVELRWQPSRSQDIVSYELTRNAVPLGTLSAEDTLTVIDASAPRDSVLDYTISSVDATGRRSSAVRLAVVNDAPRYPSLGGEVWSESMAELFWAFDNVRFRVYRDRIAVDELAASSWLDEAYTPAGHEYAIEVIASADERTSLRSASLQLPDDTGGRPPPSPGSVTFALAADGPLRLSWDAPSSGDTAFDYEVARDGEVLAVVAATSYTDTALDPLASEATYSVRTLARDGLASAPIRLAIDLVEARRATRPAEAANLSSIVYSRTALELFWSRAELGLPASRFEVSRDGNVLGSTDGTSWFDDGLTSNTRYRYAVNGLDAAGNRSAPVGINVATPGPPRAPASVRADAYGPTLVEVFWERVVSAVPVYRYELYRDDRLIATHYGLSWMDDGLAPGTAYRYAVRAVTFGGERSSLSPTFEVTTRDR